MTDLLLDLGRNATTRRLVGVLGLPLPVPTALRRGLRQQALDGFV